MDNSAKEEIARLKREMWRLRRERRGYRTFYLKTMHRYCGLVQLTEKYSEEAAAKRRAAAEDYLFDFLESHLPKYPEVCDDPGAIVGLDAELKQWLARYSLGPAQ